MGCGGSDESSDNNTNDTKKAPAGANVSCCKAFPGGYKDLTPKAAPDHPLPSPDYLKGCTLVHMTLKKGQKDEPHDHPKHYMYILNGGKLKIVGAPAKEGETMEAEMKTGDAMVMPPGVHQVENIGDTDVEVLFLEVGAHKDTTPAGHLPPQTTDADHYKTLFEDDEWMVVKMDMKAGAEDHPHSHREHVVYALSACELSIWGDPEGKGKDMESAGDPHVGPVPVTPGMVLPVPAGFHVVKNTGSTDASLMFFERKK